MLDITMVRYANDKVDSGGINESRTTELASQAVKLSFEFPRKTRWMPSNATRLFAKEIWPTRKSSIGKKLMKRADMS